MAAIKPGQARERKHFGLTRGFSLVELIAVLVIVGALAVFAAPRLNIQGFSRYSFHEELLAAARHAQKTAVASGCEVDFTVNASGYSASYAGGGSGACASSGPLKKPGGSGPLAGNGPDGVQITQGASVTFNGFGVPKGGPATIKLAGGRKVKIEARTGYVHD